ncbi:unnamed protein product [Notodromas monacha]|uniref:Kazal-like domain-containing protein n=1 Tax=Notodromas monacha TaxID=399045 RepID=A0A7R9C0N2_9CRUS|nr:unnamed protein product [Notodromas monacha]CAG0924004.1 unnamed protein product [Notodromas monacha]
MAFFVCGLGISVVQPLGLSYYDDNVKSTHAPLYHGTLSAARVLGPFFGYGLGALCLRLYVNPWDPPPGVTLEDPRWLGAWWLGYLILGSLMIVIGGCLFIFPRKLPTRPSKKIKVPVEEPEKPEPVKNGGNSTLENKGKPHFESEAAEEDILSGALDPGPTELPALKGEKYSCGTEKTCDQPGVAGVLVMVIGMVGAGFFIKKFRPSARTVTGYHILVTAFNIVGMFGAIGIGCSGLNLFGTTDSTSGQMQMHAPCNAHCSCSTAEYNVVCMEPTNVHFYNPCFGGCTGQQVIRKLSPDGSFVNKTVYTGCTCGQASMNFSTSLPINATSDLTAVVQGYCSSATCSNFASYLVLIGIIKTVTSTSRVGGLMITIRSVEKRDKSLAVGFSLVMFAILAFIPTPILYGAIIDSTCLIWRETKCGTKGNCAFYDANKFRVALHATPAVKPFRPVAHQQLLCAFLQSFLYPGDLYTDIVTSGKMELTDHLSRSISSPAKLYKTQTSQKNSVIIRKYSQVDQPPHHLLEQKFQGEFVQHEGESIHHPDHKDEDTLCGLGNWRPKVLQKFASPWSFMAAYCLTIMLQGMFFTYFLAVITTIEKQFDMKSSITGVVMAGNEISEIVFAIFITYFGGKGHRPHWVSWGIWCTIIACLIMASPQLFETEQESPLYRLPNTTSCRATSPLKMCLAQTNSALPPVCHSEGHGSIRGMFMMFASFFVSGLGVSVIQPLGLSYYDDNVPPAQAPLFHAVLSAARVLGPFSGYMLGSVCLRFYVFPGGNPGGIRLEDPRWVGAWWLGFVLIGASLVLPACLIFLFPKKIPKANNAYHFNVEMAKKEIAKLHAGNILVRRKIPSVMKRVLTNKLFMFHLIALNFQLLANVGFFTFSPKYLESQFRVSAATSNLAIGVAGVLVMAVGMLVMGIIIRIFRPRPRVLTGYHVLVTAFCICGLYAASTIGCTGLKHYGAQHPTTNILNMTSGCNSNCKCSTKDHNVVCIESTGVHFYSPCFAGCTDSKNVTKPGPDGTYLNRTVYTGCSCGMDALEDYKINLEPVFDLESLTVASNGFCDEAKCANFINYLMLLALIKVVASTARVGNLMITVRAVERRDKSIAVGMTLVFFSLCGFIPTPIIFGALIDSTCLVWSTNDCGEEGNCTYYDSEKFRKYLHMASASFMCVSLVCDLMVWMNSEHLDLYEKPSGIDSDSNSSDDTVAEEETSKNRY